MIVASAPNGVNDSAPLQSAVNVAIASSDQLYVPAGHYAMPSTVQIPGDLIVSGCGPATQFIQSSPNVTPFQVTNGASFRFQDLTFNTPSPIMQSSGSAVLVDSGGSAVSSESCIRDCQFYNQKTAIDWERAQLWSVKDCTFLNNNTDIIIRNLDNADNGDNSITGCEFAQLASMTGSLKGIAIHHFSAGGLRLINNKFNGHQFGYVLDANFISGNTTTSDLIIQGNSFEEFAVAAIVLQQFSEPTIFANISISGNQLAYSPYGIVFVSTGDQGWVTQFNIASNVIHADSIGIWIQAGVNGFVGGGNVISCTKPGGIAGIKIEKGVSNVMVGENVITGFAVNIINSQQTK